MAFVLGPKSACGSLFLEKVIKFELVPFGEKKINRVSIVGGDVIVEDK